MPATRTTEELDAAAILIQRAATSALSPYAAATETEATAVAEAVEAVVDTAVTAAVAEADPAPVGKQWAYDPITLKIVPAGSMPSLVKQPSPDEVSHQFTSGPAEATAAEAAVVVGPRHGASLADLDTAAVVIQRAATSALEPAASLLSESEVQRLRETAEAAEVAEVAEADEGGIEALQQRLAEGHLLSEPEMQRLRENAEADKGGIDTAVTTAVAEAVADRAPVEKKWAYDPTTLKIVPDGSVPSQVRISLDLRLDDTEELSSMADAAAPALSVDAKLSSRPVAATATTVAPMRRPSLDAKLSLALPQPDLDAAATLLQRAATSALDPTASPPDDAAAAPRHGLSISMELTTAMAPLVAEITSLEAQLAIATLRHQRFELAAARDEGSPARDEGSPQWSERAVMWSEQASQVVSLQRQVASLQHEVASLRMEQQAARHSKAETTAGGTRRPTPTASEAAPAPSPMPAPVPVPLGAASAIWTSPPPVPAVQPSILAMPLPPAQSEGGSQRTAEAAWREAAAAQARLAELEARYGRDIAELEASHAALKQDHAALTHDYAAAVATMALQAPATVSASLPEPPPLGAAAQQLSSEPETPRAAARRLLSLHPEMSGLAPVRTLTPTHKGPRQKQPTTSARPAAPKQVPATPTITPTVEHRGAQPSQGRQGHQVQRMRARQEAEVRARMRGVLAGPPRQHDDLQRHLYSPSKTSAETSSGAAFGTPMLDQMLLSARGQRARLSDVF